MYDGNLRMSVLAVKMNILGRGIHQTAEVCVVLADFDC